METLLCRSKFDSECVLLDCRLRNQICCSVWLIISQYSLITDQFQITVHTCLIGCIFMYVSLLFIIQVFIVVFF